MYTIKFYIYSIVCFEVLGHRANECLKCPKDLNDPKDANNQLRFSGCGHWGRYRPYCRFKISHSFAE